MTENIQKALKWSVPDLERVFEKSLKSKGMGFVEDSEKNIRLSFVDWFEVNKFALRAGLASLAQDEGLFEKQSSFEQSVRIFDQISQLNFKCDIISLSVLIVKKDLWRRLIEADTTADDFKTASGEKLAEGEGSPVNTYGTLSESQQRAYVSYLAETASPEVISAIADLGNRAELNSFINFQNSNLSKAEFAASSDKLPTVAPKLWTDRDKEREASPAAFIRKHYAPWIDNGLTNGLLQMLDVALYTAYRREVAKESKLMIPSLPLTKRTKQLSTKEARERKLASKRKYYHRNKGL